ncbi:MAG: FAD:protein FMN transferase [Flavobacteriales bacterium]|nr:FAD:protein FMN transferase [Flavobacteriales bacterium]
MKAQLKYYNLFLVLLIVTSCSKTPKEQVYWGQTQGTTYSIKVISEKEENLQESIDSLLVDFDFIFSNYNPKSLITKVNQPIDSIQVNAQFLEVFETSQEIYKRSNHLFDPTVGALVKTWGFGNSVKTDIHPATIDSLLQLTGLDKISISESYLLTKSNPNSYIDFNAIAQGYSVDIVHRFLKEKGYDNYLIEIGGEIYASGQNILKNKPWVVAIDDPRSSVENRELIETLPLTDKGLATSGNYRKFSVDEKTGEKYVHTINPITGYPKKSNILSTTVLASTAMKADGWATAFMLMDLEETKKLVESDTDLEVFILYLDDNNEMQHFASKGFKE